MKTLKAIGKTILDIILIIGALAIWAFVMVTFPIVLIVLGVAFIIICVLALIAVGIGELFKMNMEVEDDGEGN